MSGLHEELVRAHAADRHRKALRGHQAVRLVSLRRWQRRAEYAALRVRIARASLR